VRDRPAAYGLSIAALLGALALRWLLDPLMGDALPLATLIAAVAVAVWAAGYWAAAAVAVVGYLACDYLFIEPRGSFELGDLPSRIAAVAYALTCAIVIGLGEAMRRAQQRAAERGQLLEETLQSRFLAARTLAAIVESSDDAIISKTLDGIVRTWNAAAERLFGHRAEEAIGRHISLIIPPERLSEEDQIIASLRAGRRVDHFETERRRNDGRIVDVSLTVSPILDDAGTVIGASKIARDISARRQAEAERERFVTLIESSTDFIGICDLNATPVFINRNGLALVGLESVEEASRTSVWDFFFPEDVPRVRDEFFPSVQQQGHGEIEVRFRHFKTGEARWMAYKVVLLRDHAGRPSAYATVSQDVTERKLLADNLRELATRLSTADRRKNEFLATLAHELRNPLAPLSSMLEVLKRSDVDADILRRARETLDRQLKQLVRLVDDLLDLSRITHNRLELRTSEVDISTVLQQAVEASRPLADASQHSVQLALPSSAIYVRADPARLAQVFGNLINNGCKYTPAGGSIRVSAVRDAGTVVVAIADSGIGIPPDKLREIFEMFTQLEPSLERSQGGLGIGLTLAKRLVELHGGAIEARSAGNGRGSEFLVRLPVIEQSAAPAPKTSEPSTSAPSATTIGRRILIVDDNHDAATSLAMLVDMWGHETFVARDGHEAIDLAERHRPDLLLLDIGLPGLSGYEVCSRIRSRDWGRGIEIFALTGWGQEEDRRRTREAGFDGHLIKPVDPEKLHRLLSSLSRLRQRPTSL
jgi:PAS domain S-box-containing protein